MSNSRNNAITKKTTSAANKKTAAPVKKTTKTTGRAGTANTTRVSKTTKSGKKAAATRKRTQQTQDFASFHAEIAVWITIVTAILLILGNFGLCGKAGNVISSVFFGTFGIVQYVLPLVFLILSGLLIANDFSSLAVKKTILTILFFCMISAVSQMFVNFDETSVFDAAGYAFEKHLGGGFIGGGICIFLNTYLGKVAAVIIVVTVMLISLMLIFERSILKLLRQAGVSTVQATKRSREKRRERLLQREEKVSVSGTWKDTRIDGAGGIEGAKKTVKKKVVDIGEKYGLDTAFEMGAGNKTEVGKSEFIKTEDGKTKVGKTEDGKTVPQIHPEGGNAATELFVPDDEDIVTNFDDVQKSSFVKMVEQMIASEEESAGLADTAHSFKKITESRDSAGAGKPSWFETFSEIPGDEFVFEETGGVSAREEAAAASIEEAVSTEEAVFVEEDTDELFITKEEHSAAETGDESLKGGRKKKPVMDEAVTDQVKEDIDKAVSEEEKPYVYPALSLMKKGDNSSSLKQQRLLKETAMKLQQTLANFGVNVTITDVSCGPSVTRYELQPEQGVKVSRILNLSDDIKLNLAAADIRIEAPIPGKAAIGIEVPNQHNEMVRLRDLLESPMFQNAASNLTYAVGKDIAGNIIVADIAKMPHLLIAGATGSGKSVFVNTLITSILYKADPKDVKFIMIDPKVVELSTYNGIPHLLIPVVTDPQKAAGALNWAVVEMTDRYNKFAEYGVRNLAGYNKKVEEVLATGVDPETIKKLPQIVIIVDELADLMMVAPGEVEGAIVRLSQLARAAGIHLVIATQRPSVNVITGLIKANVPSRIAFMVSSGVDSRTILDMNGAEKLLGNGDMLFAPQGQQKPIRVQGAYISDKEVNDIVDFLKEKNGGETGAVQNREVAAKIETSIRTAAVSDEKDELFREAARFIVTKEKASIGMLQRMFKIGFNRASRIMEQLSEAGVVGPEEGTKPRKILMSEEQLEQYFEEYV